MFRALPVLLALASLPAWGQTAPPVTPAMWEQMTKTSQEPFQQFEKLTSDAENGPPLPNDLLTQFRQQRASAAASWLTSAHLWANVAPNSRDAIAAVAAAETAVKKYPAAQ